jgi:hypothetical protein
VKWTWREYLNPYWQVPKEMDIKMIRYVWSFEYPVIKHSKSENPHCRFTDGAGAGKTSQWEIVRRLDPGHL